MFSELVLNSIYTITFVKTLLLLSLFFFVLGTTALLYGQLEIFTIFVVLFVTCLATQIPSILSSGTSKQRPEIITDMFVISSSSAKNNRFNQIGLRFLSLPILASLFSYERKRVIAKIPATGIITDEILFVIKSSVMTLLSLICCGVSLCMIAIFTGIPYLLILIPAPLLIPLLAPITLDLQANNRQHKTASEMLAFLTYSSIVHTVNKTMFWTISSISRTDMFDALQNDAKIMLRYVKHGGDEEGYAITKMAKHHPNDSLRIFLQKYVSYIGTNTTRLGNYVEVTRDAALVGTIQKINSYTNAANTIFFMGTMAVSIVPIMFTVIAFLPNSNLDPSLLIGMMFIIPFVFVIFPMFLSTGTMFLQKDMTLSKIAVILGALSFIFSYVILQDLLIAANASILLFSGVNWAYTTRQDAGAKSTDDEIPDMLDYIAEQKKSKPNMIDIFRDYSRISNVSNEMKIILQAIISEITMYSAYDAFYRNRKFPSKTVQFVFFILYAIYQHGGGTYETLIGMAHSVRRIVGIKTQFVNSVKFSVILMILSPVIFTFSVMMTSFMTFGISDDDIQGVTNSAMMIKSSDVESIVESLKPVVLIVAVTGGLGLSRIVNYTFYHTLYLLLTGIASLICIVFWDVIYAFMQSLTVV